MNRLVAEIADLYGRTINLTYKWVLRHQFKAEKDPYFNREYARPIKAKAPSPLYTFFRRLYLKLTYKRQAKPSPAALGPYREAGKPGEPKADAGDDPLKKANELLDRMNRGEYNPRVVQVDAGHGSYFIQIVDDPEGGPK